MKNVILYLFIFISIHTLFGQENTSAKVELNKAKQQECDKLDEILEARLSQTYLTMDTWQEYESLITKDTLNHVFKTIDCEDNYKMRITCIKLLDHYLTLVNQYITEREYGFFMDSTNLQISELNCLMTNEFRNEKHLKRVVDQKLDSIYLIGLEKLMTLCELHIGFNNSVNSNQYLSFICSYQNLQRMAIEYEGFLNEMKVGSIIKKIYAPEYDMDNHLNSISKRLNKLEKDQLTMYETYNAPKQKVKAFTFSHGNDVLNPFIGNQDQEMTGSFRFEFSTDYFKARWFNAGWLKSGVVGSGRKVGYRSYMLKHPKSSMLSYQNISVGGDGFTPYIRYLNNKKLADTLHLFDRPFGSFTYIERRKFRLWPRGLVRHNGQFQIGMIGLMGGQFLQAQLHRDAIIQSQKVHGWEKQVGYGGRWLMQLNHELDIMLFSSTNRYKTIFKPRKASTTNNFQQDSGIMDNAFGKLGSSYAGPNIILNIGAKYGGYLTAFDIGATYSTLDFSHQSGHHTVLARRNNMFGFGWHVEAGLKYRYVVHNSMLEGLGYINSFREDTYDDENFSSFVLPDEDINRHLWIAKAKLNLQWRKMTLHYEMIFHKMEYSRNIINLDSPEILSIVYAESLKDQKFNSYFNNVIRPEFNKAQNRTFYGYANLGMTWMIGSD